MNWKVIEKSEIPVLVKELAEKYEVFAPVKEKGTVSFAELSPENEACMDFRNAKISPKGVLFPQTETLFTHKISEKGVEVEISTIKEKRAVLGIRPCDAKSFVLLDKFLSSGEHNDVYYSEKRENTIVVGLACNHPQSTCFCTSLGGSPFGREGSDLFLQDIDDKYLIEPITEKGEELIKKLSWLKDAEKEDIEKAKNLAREAEIAMKSNVSISGVSEKLDSMFDDPLWDRISQKCLGCGICTFLCPTCCCFDIVEEEGKRVRIWDSCQFSCFTLQGSGHNPRLSEKERMRQRIMHKFNYFHSLRRSYARSSC